MSAPAGLATGVSPVIDDFQIELGRRLKTERQRRGLTLKEIEARVGISATHLSEIERGKSSPTVGVLERIAQALGTRAAMLVESPVACESSLARTGERRVVTSVDGTIRYEVLSRQSADSEISMLLVTFSPGSHGRLTVHDGEEIIHVLQGSLRILFENEELRLEVGDTLHFRATRPHGYAAEETTVAMISTRPRYAL